MPKGRAARRSATQRAIRTCCGYLASYCLTAAAIAPGAVAADVEYGRYLSSECITCHGNAVHAAIPDITGMAETTFTEVVKAYREKRMVNPVMQSVASRLSDEEIAALAAYFASAKKSR